MRQRVLVVHGCRYRDVFDVIQREGRLHRLEALSGRPEDFLTDGAEHPAQHEGRIHAHALPVSVHHSRQKNH